MLIMSVSDLEDLININEYVKTVSQGKFYDFLLLYLHFETST